MTTKFFQNLLICMSPAPTKPGQSCHKYLPFVGGAVTCRYHPLGMGRGDKNTKKLCPEFVRKGLRSACTNVSQTSAQMSGDGWVKVEPSNTREHLKTTFAVCC